MTELSLQATYSFVMIDNIFRVGNKRNPFLGKVVGETKQQHYIVCDLHSNNVFILNRHGTVHAENRHTGNKLATVRYAEQADYFWDNMDSTKKFYLHVTKPDTWEAQAVAV